MPVADQDKSWAPHCSCDYCKKTLEGKSFFTFIGLFLVSYILKWLSLQCIFKGTAMCFKGWYRGEKRVMKFGIPRVW